jgi:hypothetical protein
MADEIKITIDQTVQDVKIVVAEFTIPGLISSDANNALVLGADKKLFVPISGGGGGGTTNLSKSTTKTTNVIGNDNGTGFTLNLGNGTDAGLSENNFTDAEKSKLANQSGTNTGDQDLSGLQPKETGKGLSQENYTTTEKNKVANIPSDTNAALSLKLDASAYNDRFKGKFTSLIALQTAFPTASVGDYAQVDAGSGSNVKNYNWDSEDGWILGGDGTGATNTDGLIEGSSNLYFTTARVLATILTGISFATGGAIVSTDTVYKHSARFKNK